MKGYDYSVLKERKIYNIVLSIFHNNYSNILLNNNHYEYEGWAICGTRGWFFEEERSGEHDEKVFKRELIRLETSLMSAGDLPKIVFLHYPPVYANEMVPNIISVLKEYGIKRVFYGIDVESLTWFHTTPKCEMPDYLYDDNLFNDVQYWLNKSVLLSSIPKALARISVGSLVDTIGESCSCGFVHDTLHLETCNLTSLLGSLTL